MKKSRSLFFNTFRQFLTLKEYFIQNRWGLFIGLFCLLMVDLLQLLIPLVIKKTIDALTLKTATSEILLRYGLIIIVIALAMAFFRYIWRHLLFGLSRKIEEGLRNKLYNHLQGLSISFYHRTKTGDIMARAINDINAVRMATGIGLVGLTDGIVLSLAAIGFMFYIHPFLTLISLTPAPLIIYATRRITRRMAVGHERVQKTFSDLTERVREAFAGIRVIKAYARETWAYERVREEGRKYISENMSLAKTFALFFPMMIVFTNIGLVIVIWFGGRLTILNQITTGDFVAFISYLNLLTWPMMAIGWVTNLIQRGSASMRRINHILEEVPEIKEPLKPKKPYHVKGNIRMQGVNFKYQGQVSPALKNITLEIKTGQDVAIVGRVGSGKTTLLSVLPRLFNPRDGMIFIDGIDIRDIPLKTLRESIGFVTQEAIIFSDTIRNNILFGRDVTEGALENALVAAQLLEEVREFEKGLDTILGERGITLSGGQRQRLTIARALISDPPILILDDALSMVDTRTEELILNRVLENRKEKTNLIVSHRPATISRADMIFVIDRGELVESGKHESLLKEGKEYAQIYEKQRLARELEMEVDRGLE